MPKITRLPRHLVLDVRHLQLEDEAEPRQGQSRAGGQHTVAVVAGPNGYPAARNRRGRRRVRGAPERANRRGGPDLPLCRLGVARDHMGYRRNSLTDHRDTFFWDHRGPQGKNTKSCAMQGDFHGVRFALDEIFQEVCS